MVLSHSVGARSLRPIPDLLDVLKQSSENVEPKERTQAIHEIGEHRTRKAAEALIEIVNADEDQRSPYHGHGTTAAWALAKIRDRDAVPSIVKLLEHDSDARRSTIVRALGEIGGDDAVDALKQVAETDREKWVRGEAVEALRNIYINDPKGRAADALLDLLAVSQVADKVVGVLSQYTRRENVEVLHVALENAKGPDAKGGVISAIGFLRQPESTRALLRVYDAEEDAAVRSRILVALARVAGPKDEVAVRKVFVAALRDEGEATAAVRALHSALEKDHESLGASPRDTLTKHLIPLLKHTDQSTRQRTAQLLGWLRGKGASEALFAYVDNETEFYPRMAGLGALANTVTSQAEAKKLILSIDESERSSQERDAFRQATNPAQAKHLVVGLTVAKDDWTRAKIAEVLGRLAHSSAASPLIAFISERKTGRDVKEAVRALYTTARPTHVPEMLKLLDLKENRDDREIAQAVMRADRLSGFKHVMPLVKGNDPRSKVLLENAGSDVFPEDRELHLVALEATDRYVRLPAIAGLGALDDDKARAALCQHLTRDEENADDVVRALLKRPDREAIGCAIDMLERVGDSRPSLRDRIASALQQVSGERLGKELAVWREWQKKGMGVGTKKADLLAALQGPDEKGKLPRDVNQQRRWLAARILLDKQHEKTRAKAAPILRAILEERGGWSTVKVDLMMALAKSGDPASRSTLDALVERRPNAEELGGLARALKAMRSKRGIKALAARYLESNGSQRDELLVELVRSTGRKVSYDPADWADLVAPPAAEPRR